MNEKNLAMLKKIVEDAMKDTEATGTVQKVGVKLQSLQVCSIVHSAM
jgi:hypothetical protein